jgi:hypothetical protein
LLVAQDVEFGAQGLAVAGDGGAECGFDGLAGGVDEVIGRRREIGLQFAAVGFEPVADQVGEADFERWRVRAGRVAWRIRERRSGRSFPP